MLKILPRVNKGHFCFYFNRREENSGYVVTQRRKPSPAPPKPSGPATPAPTPWLQLGKGPMSAGLYRELTQSSLARAPSSIPIMAQLEDGTMNMRVTRPMDKESLLNASVGVAWQASRSQAFGNPSDTVELNTPKILELDVNRMMIGQTDVRYVSAMCCDDESNQWKSSLFVFDCVSYKSKRFKGKVNARFVAMQSNTLQKKILL